MNQLIQDTRLLSLSTRTSACTLLNDTKRSMVRFNVNDFIVVSDDIAYIQFSVHSAVIPISFYTINESNNTLFLLENGYTYFYKYPSGNYTAASLITTSKTILPNRWSFSLNSVTSKFTLTNSTYPFFVLGNSTIDYILGFSGDQSSSGFSLVFPRVCNFLSLPRINIRCSDLATSTMATSSDASNLQNDIILSINNNGVAGGQILYQNNSNMATLFKCDRLDSFILSITDDDGNLIDFNGISSFFVLQFDVYRNHVLKPESFSKIVETASKLKPIDTI